MVDPAVMREAVKRPRGNVGKVNSLPPVDLVTDHFGNEEAFEENVRLEMQRNHERRVFLQWVQQMSQSL